MKKHIVMWVALACSGCMGATGDVGDRSGALVTEYEDAVVTAAVTSELGDIEVDVSPTTGLGTRLVFDASAGTWNHYFYDGDRASVVRIRLFDGWSTLESASAEAYALWRADVGAAPADDGTESFSLSPDTAEVAYFDDDTALDGGGECRHEWCDSQCRGYSYECGDCGHRQCGR